MIRKTLLLAVVVLAALLLVAPLVLSFEMDNVQQAYVNALSDKPFLKVVHNRFSRGWFSSESRVTLALDSSVCDPAVCPRMRIDSRIYHGPLPFGAFARTGLSLKPVQGIAISHIQFIAPSGEPAFKSPPPPITATTVVGLGGDQNIHVDWPAFKLDLPTGSGPLSVDSAAWSARYAGDASTTELRAHLQLPALEISDAHGTTLSLHDLQARARRKLVSPTTTEFSLKLARLGVSAANPAVSEVLEQLSLDTRINDDEPQGSGLTAGQGSLGFAQLKAANVQLGPAILKYRVERLNAGVLARIRNDLSQLDPAQRSPGMALLSLVRVYQQNAFALLHPGPAVDIPRLQLTTPSGDVNVTAHAAVSPMSEPNQASLPHLLQHLSFDLSALAPKPVVKTLIRAALAPSVASAGDVPDAEVESVLAQLTAEHWLTPPQPGKDSRYGFRLSLKNGTLQVNGQPAPAWPRLLQLFTPGATALK